MSTCYFICCVGTLKYNTGMMATCDSVTLVISEVIIENHLTSTSDLLPRTYKTYKLLTRCVF